MNIAALCDADTAVGLRLAGVHQIFVPTAEKTPTQLWHTLLDHLDDIALLIITEAFAASIGREFEEFRLLFLQKRPAPFFSFFATASDCFSFSGSAFRQPGTANSSRIIRTR